MSYISVNIILLINQNKLRKSMSLLTFTLSAYTLGRQTLVDKLLQTYTP